MCSDSYSSAEILLDSLYQNGVRLEAGDGQLFVYTPPGIMSEGLKDEIRRFKPELIPLIRPVLPNAAPDVPVAAPETTLQSRLALLNDAEKACFDQCAHERIDRGEPKAGSYWRALVDVRRKFGYWEERPCMLSRSDDRRN